MKQTQAKFQQQRWDTLSLRAKEMQLRQAIYPTAINKQISEKAAALVSMDSINGQLQSDSTICPQFLALLEQDKKIMLAKINKIYKLLSKSQASQLKEQIMQVISGSIKQKKKE